MIWYIFTLLTICVFAITIVALILTYYRKSQMKRQVNSLHILFASFFVMALALCIPPYYCVYRSDDIGLLEMIVYSVHTKDSYPPLRVILIRSLLKSTSFRFNPTHSDTRIPVPRRRVVNAKSRIFVFL